MFVYFSYRQIAIEIDGSPSNLCSITDANGNYIFLSVSAGNYQLYEASRETV
ncbi:MAG: hypothetical protein V3U84_00965 [Thiotrichaceae bacterium]